MKLLAEPRAPGSNNKALDRDGYDDGGVADLTMVIDLEDYVLRRKRGEKDYFTAAKTDTLPRMTDGQFANVNRREQKIQLAHTLFTEDDTEDVHNNSTASEVYVEKKMDEEEDEATKKMLHERLRAAKFALKLSMVMREPACAALSLAEISKRYLNCYGKAGAEVRRKKQYYEHQKSNKNVISFTNCLSAVALYIITQTKTGCSTMCAKID
jgi:hypothetical protein